jgi:hypothetical protein
MARTLFGIGLCVLLPAPVAWCDAPNEQTVLEQILDKSISALFTFTLVFDTHPPDEGSNTGNIFKFVPNGQLIIRHSAIGMKFDLANQGSPEPGDTTAALSVKVLRTGLLAQTESGEIHSIVQKVVDRNLIEPALRKVFRRKLGEAFAHTLDETVVERLSHRIAKEIVSRTPATASVREFALEIGRILSESRVITARVGIFQPAFGAPRDEAGRTRLDVELLSGPNLPYTMSYAPQTLAGELSYLIRLDTERTLRITGGIHQTEDPDATVGQTLRNAAFDEGSTKLDLRKVDALYLQLVFAGKGFEAYGSVADSEGFSIAGGVYYRLTPKTAAALDLAFHRPDPSDLTRFEKLAETTYRQGISATLLHNFNESITAYVNLGKIEAGLVYNFNKETGIGLSVYSRDKNDEAETGVKLTFRANF